jgi:Signal transduction histidine kinase
MTTILQVGSGDLRREILNVNKLNISFTDPRPVPPVITGQIEPTAECVVITAPVDGAVSVAEVAAKLTEQYTHVFVVAAPEQVDVGAVLSTAAEYIPLVADLDTNRLLATRFSLATDAATDIDRTASWRTSMSWLSYLFQTVPQSDLSFPEILSLTLTLTIGQLGYPYGYATTLSNDAAEFRATVGGHDGLRATDSIPLADSCAQQALDHGDAVAVADVADDDRVADCYETRALGMESFVAAPILYDSDPIGTICLVDDDTRRPDIMPRHTTPVETVAHWLGSVYTRLQIREDLQRQVSRLEDFSQIVSHDLQNPLNVLQGRLRILHDELGIDNQHMDYARESADRMEEIIDNTLTFAQEGGTVSDREAVAIPGLIDDCERVVDTNAAEIITVDRFRVHGDRTRLTHIFENLFRNAIEHSDATPDDPVTIRIGLNNVMPTTTRGTPTGSFSFYVEDDGPGIPPDQREQVFDVGESNRSDGTGFGLAIVNEVAEAHGWEIDVTESFSGGARFEFTGVT